MLKKDVKIGGIYTAKVTNKLVEVRIDSENRHGGWNATNLATKKAVRIKSPQRLRAAVGDAVAKTNKKAKALAEPQPGPTSSPNAEDGAKAELLPSERLGVPPTTPDVDVKIEAAAAANAATCPNCGASEFDEDGDCAKCHEPQIAVKEEKAQKPRKRAVDADKPKRMSGLDAAARVLEEAEEPLGVKQIVEIAELKGYWKSPGGKTPHATVYSAILREIKVKGDQARFRKTDRGRFAHA